MADHRRLDQPRDPSRITLPRWDPEAFGRLSEGIARFMGTARFLVYMTVFILAWIGWNTLAPKGLRFDPYTFTFLTLILSLQASYAAPLILLAQNRQAERDRIRAEEDRLVNTRTQAEAEFLARELAASRLSLGKIEATLARLEERLERYEEERGSDDDADALKGSSGD